MRDATGIRQSTEIDSGPLARYVPGTYTLLMTYRIQERIKGQTQWQSEPSGDRFETREAAEAAIAKLESTNDDGDEMEYRAVEA